MSRPSQLRLAGLLAAQRKFAEEVLAVTAPLYTSEVTATTRKADTAK